MTKLSHRSVRALLATAVVSLLAAFAAGSAGAAPGSIYFGGDGFGKCQPTVNGTLYMTNPGLTVYGWASTDKVKVWSRMVDLYGQAQTEWRGGSLGSATATTPANYASGWAQRSQWNQYSRFQFYVAWYKSTGPGGTMTPVWTQTVTLQSYHAYAIDYNFSLYFTGNSSACYG
jgi:hypothetical protein